MQFKTILLFACTLALSHMTAAFPVDSSAVRLAPRRIAIIDEEGDVDFRRPNGKRDKVEMLQIRSHYGDDHDDGGEDDDDAEEGGEGEGEGDESGGEEEQSSSDESEASGDDSVDDGERYSQ